MPCILADLLPSMSPKTPVLGLHLTHETASNHLKTCLSLLSLLAHQFPAIHHMDTNQLNFVTHLQSIQLRHLEIQTKLSGLVKDLAGALDLVDELGDGLASMKEKVRRCNHNSQSASQMVAESGGRASRSEMERNWELAATTYWPEISMSYAMIKPLLECLRDEVCNGLDILEGKIPIAASIRAEQYPSQHFMPEPKYRLGRSSSIVSWFGGRRQKSKSKSYPKFPEVSSKPKVQFARDVKVRYFRKDEDEDEQGGQQKELRLKPDHVLPLTSDRKRTAGTYGKKTKGKGGSSNGGGWIPSNALF